MKNWNPIFNTVKSLHKIKEMWEEALKQNSEIRLEVIGIHTFNHVSIDGFTESGTSIDISELDLDQLIELDPVFIYSLDENTDKIDTFYLDRREEVSKSILKYEIDTSFFEYKIGSRFFK